jgi:hypothetical protein
MRRLKGAIPRAFKDHRSAEARIYTDVLRSVVDRLGELPKGARPTLREFGRAVLALEDLAEEYTREKSRGRITVMRRIRREQSRLRLSMLALEKRLEQFAGLNVSDNDLARQLQAAMDGEHEKD